MYETKNCYETCINKRFLLNDLLLKQAEEIIAESPIRSTIGRPSLKLRRTLNGVYYLLRTGIQWNALPKCFGSYSAVHRLFQKLQTMHFFEKLWHKELQQYELVHGLQLENQASDCTHIKSPLGQEKTGKSPVDRRKLGTKRSIIVEGSGIPIGYALDAGNRHDSKLFEASIRSIPLFLLQPYYKEMHLDSAYDSKTIQTILFNFYYIPRISRNKRRSKQLVGLKTEKKRWIVESTHSWMNRFRRLLIRFEKSAQNYIALMQFAFSIIIFNRFRI
jgi:putative transposase